MIEQEPFGKIKEIVDVGEVSTGTDFGKRKFCVEFFLSEEELNTYYENKKGMVLNFALQVFLANEAKQVGIKRFIIAPPGLDKLGNKK